jgi:hypothetical protein
VGVGRQVSITGRALTIGDLKKKETKRTNVKFDTKVIDLLGHGFFLPLSRVFISIVPSYLK